MWWLLGEFKLQKRELSVGTFTTEEMKQNQLQVCGPCHANDDTKTEIYSYTITQSCTSTEET